MLDRLKGDAASRRVIAGRVGGQLWLFASIATPVLLLLPGVEARSRGWRRWSRGWRTRSAGRYGRGYPDGPTEIPEGAALLAAADCFDVMTVARPYSRAKSEVEALAECRELAGLRFTPEAVDALEAALGALSAAA